jgi:hypothetical protein
MPPLRRRKNPFKKTGLRPAFIFLPMTFTVNACEVKIHNSIDMILLLPYTLVGFEPGPSVLQPDTMITAPRRLFYFQLSLYREKQRMNNAMRCR